MDAVATNLGVDSDKISEEERKKKEREREKDKERREKERERRREKSRERRKGRSRSKSRDRKIKKEIKEEKDTEVKKEPAESKAIPVPPSSMPPLPPGHPGLSQDQKPPLPGASGDAVDDKDAAAKIAVEKAQQLELQKKLMEGDEAVSLSQQENMQIKGQSARHLVMQKLMGAHGGLKESKVLVLRNMVSHEEVDESLQEEIEEECGKFGEVDNVIIYQERQSEEEDSEILVKIFVEFATANAAKAGMESLNGRYFGGRHVRANIYDQVMYEEQDFSH